MQKPILPKLIFCLLCCAGLALSACSYNKLTDRLPGIYRMDIQQGNVITQEMVDQLRPGMEKRQVQFVMGTPLLVDSFHEGRWDYLYSLKTGGGDKEQKRLTLFFENDRLARLEGDVRPSDEPPTAPTNKETIVEAPKYAPDAQDRKGIFRRALEKIGFGGEDAPE